MGTNKYKIRQYSIVYGKEKARRISKEEEELELKPKDLEIRSDETMDQEEQTQIEETIISVKVRLQEIADYKTEGLMLRSQADWYEKGEKSNSYFLRLESRNKVKKNLNKMQKEDGTYTVDPREILNAQAEFFQNLYTSQISKTEEEIRNYLSVIQTPSLTNEDKQSCEGLLSVEECLGVLKTFKNNKSPGNDGIPAEFYKQFWPVFGSLLVNSFNKSFQQGEMSSSQKQAVITLLDKGKDRSLLKNWRPISLLNTDYKIASKAIAKRLTKHLPK